MVASKSSASKFIWPVIAIALGGGAILLSGREPVGPGGRPIVRDAVAYQREGSIVRELIFETLKKAEDGGEVTEPERAKLREALPHMEAMNAYAPIKVDIYFAMGQIYQALGEYEQAGVAYEQAIANQIADWEEKNNPNLAATVARAKALLAETMLEFAIQRSQAGAKPDELKKIRTSALSWAEQSVKEDPGQPRHLAAKASALLALGREEEAKAAVMDAAVADPKHFKVRPLKSLMGL